MRRTASATATNFSLRDPRKQSAALDGIRDGAQVWKQATLPPGVQCVSNLDFISREGGRNEVGSETQKVPHRVVCACNDADRRWMGWDGTWRTFGTDGETFTFLTTRLVNLASVYIYLPIFPFSPLLFGAFAS